MNNAILAILSIRRYSFNYGAGKKDCVSSKALKVTCAKVHRVFTEVVQKIVLIQLF